MKFNKNVLKQKWFAYTFAMCSAVVLYLVLTHIGGLVHVFKGIWRVGAPVFMAFVIAYIIDPLVKIFHKNVFYNVRKRKLRHTLSVLLSFLSVILFFVILMVALVPQIVDSVVMFAKNLNGYVYSFQRLMLKLSSFAARYDIDLSKFISSSDELLQSITRILPENVNKIVNVSYGLGTKVFDWVISFILAIYLTLDSEKLKKGFVRLMKALVPANVFKSTTTFWNKCNKILVQYIAFDIMDGLIIGILNWIFMLIMKMPYVAIISVIVGVTNLAPTFGPMVGAVMGAFILVLVNPWNALWFLLFTVVLQTFDGYILKPRLFGESLGVPAVWILISIIIGGRFIGVIGILLAIPFAAIVDFIYHDYILSRLENRSPEDSHLAGDVVGAAVDTIEEVIEETFINSEIESARIKEEIIDFEESFDGSIDKKGFTVPEDKAGAKEKAGKSAEKKKTGKADEKEKAGKTADEAKPDQADTKEKADKADKAIEKEKAGKAGTKEKAEKADAEEKAEEADKANTEKKTEKADKADEQEKDKLPAGMADLKVVRTESVKEPADQADKSEKAEKSEKVIKKAAQAKPVKTLADNSGIKA
ncbi:MAG: AI-2E family transporter [Eubacteriales bacterium]|nr:AI-2E family transporter [Eubacteriales bacterium]